MRIPKARKSLERNIQSKVEKYARSLGCDVRKMNGLGYRSWPDDMFIAPKGGIVFFLEAKRENEEPTFLQCQKLQELNGRGIYASWYDNVEEGKRLVERGIAGGM